MNHQNEAHEVHKTCPKEFAFNDVGIGADRVEDEVSAVCARPEVAWHEIGRAHV